MLPAIRSLPSKGSPSLQPRGCVTTRPPQPPPACLRHTVHTTPAHARADLTARLVRGAASIGRERLHGYEEELPPRGEGWYLGGYMLLSVAHMLPYKLPYEGVVQPEPASFVYKAASKAATASHLTLPASHGLSLPAAYAYSWLVPDRSVPHESTRCIEYEKMKLPSNALVIFPVFPPYSLIGLCIYSTLSSPALLIPCVASFNVEPAR